MQLRDIWVYIHSHGISHLFRPLDLVSRGKPSPPGRLIHGYRIPLEPFRVADRWDTCAGEYTTGRISELENRRALDDRTVTPGAIMGDS